MSDNADTNVTNPDLPDFGQWVPGLNGAPPAVSKEAAAAILDGRGFYGSHVHQAFRNRDTKTGKLSTPIGTNVNGTTGHTFRTIQCFPKTDAYGSSVSVNFQEGEVPDGYFYTDQVTLGLSGDMPG